MFAPPLPPGQYKLVVVSAIDKFSKAGNEMIELVLESENKRWIYDYLIGLESGQWKLRRFCDSAGILEQYERGEITAADCEGQVVEAEVVLDHSEEYGDKNKVKTYIKREMPKMAVPDKNEIAEDDIPF